MRELIRPNILALEPYHSAREHMEEGILLDANENPFPNEFEGVLLNRYPDPNQLRLRQALADHTGARVQQVLAGAGSDEVLDWIFKVFCRPRQDQVALFEPTYGMYRVMAGIYEVPVAEFRLDSGFEFQAATFLDQAPAGVKVAFLCSPNNPTGNLLDREQVLILLAQWPGVVVADEAYIEFSGARSLASAVETFPNLVVLRTFSKAFASAGLRLGYAVAAPEVIDCFLKVKAPYNLSAVTQRQGIELLRHWDRYEMEIRTICSERERLREALEKLSGVGTVFPSDANFLLFTCRRATEICARLQKNGVIVRDRSALPGLSNSIRVTIGTAEENSIFLDELSRLLN